LDLLLSVGILGALPVAIALIWWFRLAFGRDLAKYRGQLVIPCLAFVVAILIYNLGGGSRVFFSLNAFLLFFMAVIVRLADGLPVASRLPVPGYGSVGAVSPRRRIRYVGGRS
jgi:O-antigen ligase